MIKTAKQILSPCSFESTRFQRMAKEFNLNIVNCSLALSAVAFGSNLKKIEVFPEKGKAVLKNENGQITLEPTNYKVIKEVVNNLEWPKFIRTNRDDNNPTDTLGFYAEYENSQKNGLLNSNKLKTANLYREFLFLQNGLPVVAPFFDPNSGVQKMEYYRNIMDFLKIVIQQRNSTYPVQFDTSLIRGALKLNLFQEQEVTPLIEEQEIPLLIEEAGNIQDEILLLRRAPGLPYSLSVNHFLNNNTEVSNQISIFSTLMTTCYQSIHKIDISSYHSEVTRRMSLRFLYEFEEAYTFLKGWVSNFATRSKGMKSATQVRSLLTGKTSIDQLFEINSTKSDLFNIKHIVYEKKRKRSLESDEILINIPGFSGTISLRKLNTFTIAGPRLMQLFKTLNNNWTTLDLVDNVTITWLENFRKEEWTAFINQIKGNFININILLIYCIINKILIIIFF